MLAGGPGEGQVGSALWVGGLWAAGISGSSQLGRWRRGEVQPGDSSRGRLRGPSAVPLAAEADTTAAC